MPALAEITLTTTAGSSVFKPVTIDKNDVATFRDQSTGVPVGYPSLTHSISEPASNAVSGVYRVKLQIAVPRLNVKNPVDASLDMVTVDGVTRGHVEFLLPMQGPVAERTQILELVKAALNDVNIKSTVENIEHFY